MARRGRKPSLSAGKRKLQLLIGRKVRIRRSYDLASFKLESLERKLRAAKEAVNSYRNQLRETMGYTGYGEF